MQEKYKYLGKNTIIFAISSFGTKILSFLLVPLYTAVLTTEEYGIADLITTTATLLVFVLTVNISSSVLRFTLEKCEQGRNVLSYGCRVLTLGTLWCGLVLGIIYLFNFFGWPGYYYLFILLYFFSTALYEMISNYLRAIDKVKEVAVAGVISSSVIILCNIFFLMVFRTGITGYLISLVAGPLVASLYGMVAAKEPLKTYFVLDCDKALRKEMLQYCAPLIFNNIALWINGFLDRYFIIYFCGVAENGVYSVAGKIPSILSLCYSVFANAWTLSAIKEFDPEDRDGFFSNTYNMYNALMTVACSFIVLINIPLAKFLFSKDFFVAWRYSSVLLLSVMFNTFTVFLGSVFTAAKKTKAIATTTIISAVTNIVFNTILIPVLGVIGAAIATAISYAVMWLIRYITAKQYINLKINILKHIASYVLIVIQIAFEHFEGHFYLGQIIVLISIFCLYINNIKMIVSTFRRRIVNK